jgi:hypothetical protein
MFCFRMGDVVVIRDKQSFTMSTLKLEVPPKVSLAYVTFVTTVLILLLPDRTPSNGPSWSLKLFRIHNYINYFIVLSHCTHPPTPFTYSLDNFYNLSPEEGWWRKVWKLR